MRRNGRASLRSIRLPVYLSVHRSSRHSLAAAADLLLSARRAGDIDRLLHGAPAARRSAANAGSAMLTADVRS